MNIEIILLNSHYFLSRESECAILLARGYSNKQISRFMLISLKTVQTYLLAIYQKLGLTGSTMNNRCMAIHSMISRNIISVEYDRSQLTL